MQPLDVAVYGPFKAQYSRALDGWMRSNPGKTVTIYQVAGLVSQAFMTTVTPQNVTSGFRSTGIFPDNRNIFPDEAFAPSIPSDRPNPELQPELQPATRDVPPPGEVIEGLHPADDPPEDDPPPAADNAASRTNSPAPTPADTDPGPLTN